MNNLNTGNPDRIYPQEKDHEQPIKNEEFKIGVEGIQKTEKGIISNTGDQLTVKNLPVDQDELEELIKELTAVSIERNAIKKIDSIPDQYSPEKALELKGTLADKATKYNSLDDNKLLVESIIKIFNDNKANIAVVKDKNSIDANVIPGDGQHFVISEDDMKNVSQKFVELGFTANELSFGEKKAGTVIENDDIKFIFIYTNAKAGLESE